jgi:hypothetical protein
LDYFGDSAIAPGLPLTEVFDKTSTSDAGEIGGGDSLDAFAEEVGGEIYL